MMVEAMRSVVNVIFTLSSHGQTVGQQLLGVRYAAHSKAGGQGDPWISPGQKAALAVLDIACPWLRERLSVVLTSLRLSPWEQQVEQCLRWVETGVKGASLINFLVFLHRGVYLSLLERLVGVSAQFPRRQAVRQVSFDFMTRELLWHGFSELLVFLLPLISIQRIRNTATRWLLPRQVSPQDGGRQRSCADLMACIVCGDWPVQPQGIGCRHVFCYFCIASNLKADPGYLCPSNLKADPGYLCPACGGGHTPTGGTVTPQPIRPTVGPH
ncbi:hypothetical protein ACOMHN_045530 [Nucella lapillus]